MKEKKIVCKICGSHSENLLSLKVLKKYDTFYYVCNNCEFIQTENPYWLKEAYSSAIIESDTGILRRNEILFKITAIISLFTTGKYSKILDYGGGYGIVTRMLRDIGVDCYWTDKHAENLFAKGFEDKGKRKYDIVTAFELFEHLEDPIKESKKILKIYDPEILLFSTTLHGGNPPKDWWYFVPEGGQHISLYSRRSLKMLADKIGMKFSTNGVNLHILSKKKISDFFLMAVSGMWPTLSFLLKFFYKSKTIVDSKTIAEAK